MYMRTGYVGEVDEEIIDKSQDIIATCAGHYKLITMKQFKTSRILGRQDYQLIYIAKGKGHFMINGEYRDISEGNVVLYRPGDTQIYNYKLEDQPDVYWVHFSGSSPDKILEECGLNDKYKSAIFHRREYTMIMDKIIQEFQQKESDYLSMCHLYVKQLLLLIKRGNNSNAISENKKSREIRELLETFQEDYQNPLSIDEYAKQKNISVCWLIRSFKQQVGVTPQTYIIDLKIERAKELLLTSEYTVNEISEIIGYDDSLYFSRLFKKRVGISPTQYRKKKNIF